MVTWDFSKTFNTVSHSILLGKVSNFNVMGELSDGSGPNSCSEGGYNKLLGQVTSGVTQISLLDPVLLNVFMNAWTQESNKP